MFKECCKTCLRRYDVVKFDYTNGGCEHTVIDGFICMAFADEKQAVLMVGNNENFDICECYMPNNHSLVLCGKCKFWDINHISCEGLARCNTGESGIRYRKSYDFCSRGKRRI